MAKRRKHLSVDPTLPGQIASLGPMISVDIKSVVEGWSDYRLSDGSVLSVKPMIADVRRVKGKFNEQGDPLYLVTGAMVIRTKAPPRLRKKG